MGLARVVIDNIRCIAHADLALSEEQNLIIGPNGAGKTSFLESIYLLGRGRSFRSRQSARLVRDGTEGFSVFGELAADGGGERRLGIALDRGRLAAKVDGDGTEGLAALARAFPVHVIDPRLHYLVEAGPSERRRFIDGGVFHVEPSYLERWRTYRRLLGQRNAALKRGAAADVDVWRAPFIEAGEAVSAMRAGYTTGLATAVAAVSARLLGRSVELVYRQGWREEYSLAEALEASADRERRVGLTQAGPHRADVALRLGGGLVRDVASRGQQKLVAAALVLGQILELARLTGQRPALLVDDPAAELDDEALARLLDELESLPAQRIVTGLRLASLAPRETDPVFHVEQGRITPVVY